MSNTKFPRSSRRVASRWKAIALFCAMLGMSARAFHQQAEPAPPDVQKLGPQVGTRVPDFNLVDQHGRSRTLTSLIGSKGLMLVFFRSADW